MKWLTTVLSLYLLSLSLWPCADETLPLTGQERATVLIAAGTADLGSHQHQHDTCTPFCSCACCAVAITVFPHLFSYSLAPSVESRPIAIAGFAYAPVRWAEPLSAIWQPPQIRV